LRNIVSVKYTPKKSLKIMYLLGGFLVALGIELRASGLLGRYSTT
jgi:hypothetical protein